MSDLVRRPESLPAVSGDALETLYRYAHDRLAATEQEAFSELRSALLRVAALADTLSPLQRVQLQAAVADYRAEMRRIPDDLAIELDRLLRQAFGG